MKPLSELYLAMHDKEESIAELFKFKKLKKLLSKFKPFKKPKKPKQAFDAKKAKKAKSGFFAKLAKKFKLKEASDEAKKKALIKHLIAEGEIDNAEGIEDIDMDDYMVLTDDEASDMLRDYIEDSIQYFNNSFLYTQISVENANKVLGHEMSWYDEDQEEDIEFGDEEEAFFANTGMDLAEYIQGLQDQEKGSEIRDLVDDWDGLIEEAENVDGRGHFLSSYDGVENEVDDLYIYRTN